MNTNDSVMCSSFLPLIDDIETEFKDELQNFSVKVSKKLDDLRVKITCSLRENDSPSTSVMDSNEINSIFQATEIRCQEQSKGGLKFDVILADPAGTPPAPKRAQSPTRATSVENIEEKLKAAEERRLSLEQNKVASIAAKLSKIEEVSKKKDEQTTVFINQTKEALAEKMGTHIEKRDAYITEIKTKLKDHWEAVEKTRLTLEQQASEVRKEVEEKLTHASAQRSEVLKNIVDRLKKHEDQVKKVKASNQEKIKELDSQIQAKLEQAQQRRIEKEKEQLDKLKIQEKRAEMVRQNKKLSFDQEDQNTASSG